MKVAELIDKLKAFDQEMVVVTGGFDEEGFADIRTVKIIHMKARQLESAKQIIGEYEKDDSGSLTAILIDHSWSREEVLVVFDFFETIYG